MCLFDSAQLVFYTQYFFGGGGGIRQMHNIEQMSASYEIFLAGEIHIRT